MYLLHWKSSVPLQETMDTMEKLKSEGKIKSWGVSNFDTKDLHSLFQLPAGENCASNQIKYNLMDRGSEFDLLSFMKEQQIPLIAYSPVMKGRLNQLKPKQKQLLEELAQDQQASIQQILLAWCIRNGHTILMIFK